jgi:hypothetical protein
MSPSRISPLFLPGKVKSNRWALDREGVGRVVNRLTKSGIGGRFNGDVEGGTREEITVNVWNATGQPRLAEQVSRSLRTAGYDVLDWGNYEAYSHRTRVVDRTGNVETARRIAVALGIESAVLSEVKPSLLVDVEVILGKDFNFPAPSE